MVDSPSPPILTLGKLWYNLQDIDPAIAYVSEILSRPDPDPPPRPEVLERFRLIRQKRKELLQDLLEKKRAMILEAMECERRRHAITMEEMRKLLPETAPQPAFEAELLSDPPISDDVVGNIAGHIDSTVSPNVSSESDKQEGSASTGNSDLLLQTQAWMSSDVEEEF